MANKTIDLSFFFSTSNQEEGVWFEPTVNGVGIGIELKVTGTESIKNEYAHEVFNKDALKIEKMTDSLERVEAMKKRLAKYIASLVTGIRGKEGIDLTLDGKPLEYSTEVVEKLFYENYQIQDQVLRFARDTANFMKRKK